MSSEINENPAEAEEQQLCTSCVAPNDPAAHFCIKCGAPLSSYAATAPFERLFAEGFILRQAIENPRSLIVMLVLWAACGMPALFGFSLFVLMPGIVGFIFAMPFILFSAVMIWKITRKYLNRKRADTEDEGDVHIYSEKNHNYVSATR